jgi:crotonobetainyl-CoA:carnitine CoA-transferase CaiB-like acyl-CoA transferase
MSGNGYVTGDEDRPPLMPSFTISNFFGVMSAAVGALVALNHRNITGEGQHVDAPAHLGLAWPSGAEVQGLWSVDNTIVKRSGPIWRRAQTGTSSSDLKYISIPIIYDCKDGYVRFVPFVEKGMLPSTNGITKWVVEDGEASETLKNYDWSKHNWQTVSQETMDSITESFKKFFKKHTKDELWEGAQEKGIQLYPLLTTKDMLEFEQLNIREYWEEVEHPELNTSVIYPGVFNKITEEPIKIRRRPPLIGEHNKEIYEKELGYSREEILTLKQTKVI